MIPKKFPDPKPSQHSRLTLSEAIAQYHDGLLTAAGLLYHAIRNYRKDGQTFRITNVSDFCQKIEISRRAFYKAKAKLIDSGYLEEEIFGTLDLVVTNRSQVRTNGNTCHQPCTESEQSCTENEQSCTESERLVTLTPLEASQDKGSEAPSDIYQLNINSLSDSEREENSVSQNSFPTQSSETSNNLVPSSSSSNSLVKNKNLGLDQKRRQNHSLSKSLNSNISNNSSEPRPQTYSDLIGALDESAQEKFLLFAKKKAASLPKPPTLSNRWIEKNFDELYEQWRASEQRLQENLALRTASLTASDQEARREEPSEKMVSLSGDLLRKLKEEVMKNV